MREVVGGCASQAVQHADFPDADQAPGLKPAGGRGLRFAGSGWDGQPSRAALSGRRQVPVAGAAVHRPPPAATDSGAWMTALSAAFSLAWSSSPAWAVPGVLRSPEVNPSTSRI